MDNRSISGSAMMMQSPKRVTAMIRMARQKDSRGTFLLVEGDSDNSFYKSMISKNRAHIVPMSGKEAVLEGISRVNKAGIRGVIAIVDSDYDRILGQMEKIDNLFYTDTTDIETMLLSSGAYKQFESMFGNADRIASFEKQRRRSLYQCMRDIGAGIGCLRMVNARESFCMKFPDVGERNNRESGQYRPDRIYRYFDENYNFAYENYLEDLLERSQNPPDRSNLMLCVRAVREKRPNPWYVCRGHDMMQIVAVFYEYFGGTLIRKSNANGVEAVLMGIYASGGYLRSTELMKSIRKWQEQNPEWVILNRNMYLEDKEKRNDVSGSAR
jgi:hypothetical protein